MAGYSGTPLAKKLGIREGTTLRTVSPPPNYLSLLAPLPEGVTQTSRVTAKTDIVHLFTSRRADLARALRSALASMRRDAVIWVSWPKRTSKVPTDITEDVIREVALPMGLVDIKVCAVDDTWSGLKLVIRRGQRSEGKGQK